MTNKSAGHEAKLLASVFDPKLFPPTRLPEIAFLGRSNVGKSSLINALLGEKGLARTSSQPGKTASINFYSSPLPFLLVDLPGFGYAKVPQSVRLGWSDLIEAYFSRKLPQACVIVVDSRRKIEAEERVFLEWLQEKGVFCLLVLSKVDKLNREEKKKAQTAAEKESLTFGASVMLFSKEDKQSAKALLKALEEL